MIKCEVCGSDLIRSGNANIYTCKPTIVWNEEHKNYIEERHYTCHLDDDGGFTYKNINIFPICFHLFYDENKTTISKLIVNPKVKNNQNMALFSAQKKLILQLDHVLELPWNNKEQILQKLNMYSLFS